MRAPGIVQRHPELRWLALIAVLTAAAVTVSSSISDAFREDVALPVTQADQLVARLQQPYAGGYSGTVQGSVDLGLPKSLRLAMTDAAAAGELVRGSSRLRYWYGGPDRQRVSVIKQTSEQDLFRNGSDVWEWDTATDIARHSVIGSAADTPLPLRLASTAAFTPPQLAAQLLDSVGADSDTALRSGDVVGDRETYELVVHPETDSSRIGEIDIDVDGREGVPLRVRIYPIDGVDPVLDVSFGDDLTFAVPAAQNFDFSPPDTADVRSADDAVDPSTGEAPVFDSVHLLGSGWDTIAAYRSSTATRDEVARVATRLVARHGRAVKGKWGRGWLLTTPIVTVLATHTGRLVAGAVTADVLYRAVG